MLDGLEAFSLASRTALVTGGGSGIGAAFARGLALAGANVVVVGRREEPLVSAAMAVNKAAARECCFALAADVTEYNRLDSIVAEAAALAGTPPTILFNNAGANVRRPAAELTAAHWDHSLGLMLTSPFFLARACAPHMAAARYGRIVNTASLLTTLTFRDALPYGVAKSGVAGLTRGLAEAYSPAHGYEGITCNAIAPGYVRTEMTAAVFDDTDRATRLAAGTIAGRNSEADDLVGAAVFLSSPASAYLTGQARHRCRVTPRAGIAVAVLSRVCVLRR